MKTGRNIFSKYKKVLYTFASIVSFLPLGYRKKLYALSQNMSGKIGIAIRYIFLKSCCVYCGDNVRVEKGCYLFNIENMYIGNNVSIHPMCYIEAKGGIEIHDNVSIAHHTTIMSATHEYSCDNVPIKYQPLTMKKVIIETDVWIGAKVMIMAGIRIGKRVVIGAGSIVTHDVPSNVVIAGNPAKKIRDI